ncbi:hypothetical protein [Pseudoxanthomonas winnipegensis]|uniref:hypothetical protein n=1 Tax=Pseudoxanthomonas winnipegensis TaxID=2480810 RepID=UPI0013EEC15A|nr:hypothetical protein [Pseudoxanthomonas winnipegensis]
MAAIIPLSLPVRDVVSTPPLWMNNVPPTAVVPTATVLAAAPVPLIFACVVLLIVTLSEVDALGTPFGDQLPEVAQLFPFVGVQVLVAA